jgi:DNA invertase Pin-like site-specific DNA recombinase
MPHTSTSTAYSYVRFSTPEQAKGDSLRRQTEATAAWCEKNGVALDAGLTLRDLGVSAFRGAHRDDKHCLAQFLRAVNQGRVARGSYLVIENLDRLTREDERTALRLWLDILDAGVNIVQLSPETVFRHERSDMTDIIRAIIELSRGHSESRLKSKRNGASWEAKRKAARAGGHQPARKKDGRLTRSMTNQLPAWVRDVRGSLELIPEKAAAVHRIHVLAAEGMGAGLIVKTLAHEKVKPLGRSGEWSRAYVSLILKDERAIGTFQPRHADGRKAGDAIPNYFPPAITEAEWLASRSGSVGRKQPRGRVGEYINVFSGLLFNAREGDAYYVGTRTTNGKHRRVLMARRATENASPCYGFDFDVFEKAVLAKLREVDPADVLGEAPGQDEIIVLSAELERVQALQATFTAELLKGGDVPALVKASKDAAEMEGKLRAKLDEARRQARHSDGETWGQAMSLAEMLEQAADPKEIRLKLRASLRGVIAEIWLLVVPRSETRRLCAVQVFFKGGATRLYVIRLQSAGNLRQGGWDFLSDALKGPAAELDLRQREHATQLADVLSRAPVEW